MIKFGMQILPAFSFEKLIGQQRYVLSPINNISGQELARWRLFFLNLFGTFA